MGLLHCALFLIAANIIFAKTNAIPPVVQLKNGLMLIGRSGTTEANNTYYSFRGVPFAEPPVNERRFKAPVPLSGTYYGKILLAQKDCSPCPQASGRKILGSEDCLCINVYTPRVPKISNLPLLPVMVWVYGGGFLTGTSENEIYGPDYFMDQEGVIIVTLNYRLGILGWLSTGDDACPGNNGLKDQILALKWVNENIRSFGGNPDQVTLFGQSSGAASIGYLVQSPLTKGLYHRVMMLSGSSLCPWTFVRKPRNIARAIAKSLNIKAKNSEELVNELRKIRYKRLIIVQELLVLTAPLLLDSYSSLPFGPVIEPLSTEAVVTTTSYELLTNRSFQHVPYLLTVTSLEGITLLKQYKYYASVFLPQSFAPESMGIYDRKVLKETNNEIINHYFGPPPVNYSDPKIAQYLSDNHFERSILETATLYSQQEQPVFLGEFSYEGYLGSGNRTYQGPGVAHADDIFYMWRVAALPRTPTPSDLITRKRMITYMTNFAITGNPTPTKDPVLQNITWPRTTAGGNGNLAYLDIGDNLVTGVNPFWDMYQWWKALFAKYANSPYDTY